MTRWPWGKCNDAGAEHPLVDHCLDVATVFRALLEQPNLGRGLAKLAATAKERLAVIAFLHDFGKCNRGFQAKADPQPREIAGRHG